MYERVNVNCARENSTGDWESGIHNFIFQADDICGLDSRRLKIYDKMKMIYEGTCIKEQFRMAGLEAIA